MENLGKVIICKHCHSYFKGEAVDPRKHPNPEANYARLERRKDLLGDYAVIGEDFGAGDNTCGSCGLITAKENTVQIVPTSFEMVSILDSCIKKEHLFFSINNCNFFNTAFVSDAVDNMFVTRETFYGSDGYTKSCFSIRRFSNDRIDTVGDFMQHDNFRDACKALAVQVYARRYFWREIKHPHCDPERSRGEVSEMHEYLLERIDQTDFPTMAKKYDPLFEDQNIGGTAFYMRHWEEDSKNSFFHYLEEYHNNENEEEVA